MDDPLLPAPEQAAIKVRFDPSFMCTSMTLWRDAIDMRTPVHDDFKIHFMNNRLEILRGFEKTASAWSTLLNYLKPDDEQDAQLMEEVRRQLREFEA